MTWHPAPGKLNLFLHVLGLREDGYHELQTAFRLIERADRVGIRLRSDGARARARGAAGVPAGEDLCLKAARALKDHALARHGPPAQLLGADLALEKHLPIGGGLGGGSSDAASVLLVLNRLWDLNLGRAELLGIAAGLGADVPLFVFGENAIGEGVGERLSPLQLPPAWYLVLVPQVSVSTAEIFAERALTGGAKPLTIPPLLSGQARNDLEPVVAARYPDVAAHLEWLRSRAPAARMTGSGACVFAEFGAEAGALAVHAALPPAMHGFVTRGLERHPLYDWAD